MYLKLNNNNSIHISIIIKICPIYSFINIQIFICRDESIGREIYIITDRKAKEKGNIIQFKIEKLQGEQPNIIMKALGDQSLGWIELIKK